MSVYTTKGDSGTTRILSGIELSKADVRIKTIGSLDELSSYIGLVRSFEIISEPIKNFLLEVQNDLFKISAMLSCSEKKLYDRIPKIVETDIEKIEILIDKYEKLIPVQRFFILPGGSMETSFIHIARAVSRRAETYAVELNEKQEIDHLILKYLNRLSDYLYIIARYVAHQHGIVEQKANLRE